MAFYREAIAEALARRDEATVDPRHVEAWMRLGRGTLDGLSGAAFDAEVGLALLCMHRVTPDDNEALARSYGL